MKRIIAYLSEVVSRRNVLARAAWAVVAALFGVGRHMVAGQCPQGLFAIQCCCLCTTTPCDSPPTCSALWCWTCP